MYYTVYKITNLINNKIYIGVHETIDLKDNYMGSGKLIKSAIKKYGIENFKKEYIAIFNEREKSYDLEKELVNLDFINDKNTYNINVGGNGGWVYVNNLISLNQRKIWAKKASDSILKEVRKENGKYMGTNFGGSNKLSKKEIEERLNLLLDIDFSKIGWVKKVAEKLNVSHTQAKRFIESNYKKDYYKRFVATNHVYERSCKF